MGQDFGSGCDCSWLVGLHVGYVDLGRLAGIDCMVVAGGRQVSGVELLHDGLILEIRMKSDDEELALVRVKVLAVQIAEHRKVGQDLCGQREKGEVRSAGSQTY